MPIIGNGPCLACGEGIPVKETGGNGCHSWTCPWCEVVVYAKKGTQAQRILAPRIKPLAPASSAPAVQPGVTTGDGAQPGVTSPPPAKKLPWMP